LLAERKTRRGNLRDEQGKNKRKTKTKTQQHTKDKRKVLSWDAHRDKSKQAGWGTKATEENQSKQAGWGTKATEENR
jgi:hypothetical protein